MTTLRSLHRPALVLATAGIGVLALTGCGSAGGSTGTPTTSASAPAGADASPGRTGGRVPGVSGTIAAVDGRTLQVQDTSAQTAVVFTAKTAITARVATTSSALAVGDCVSVRTAPGTSTASTSPGAANAGTGPLAATTVTILSTTGGCSTLAGGRDGGGFPGGGTPPSGMPSGAPSGMPSDAPSGMPSGGRAGGIGFGTTGEVTTLASGTFTVTPSMPAFGRPGATSATPTATASAPSAPVTVTYTDATTFLTTSKAKASSITVGLCVRATGATDDTGKLTATTLLLSHPVDGSCTPGVRGG